MKNDSIRGYIFMDSKMYEKMVEKILLLTSRINELEEKVEKLERKEYLGVKETERAEQLTDELGINDLLEKKQKESLGGEELSHIWKTVLDIIKEKLSRSTYNTWFTNLKPVKYVDNKLLVQAPNIFIQEWVSERYKDYIDDILAKVLTDTEILIFV